MIYQFFSDKYQLIHLRFDISDDNSAINIHQCLMPYSIPLSSSITDLEYFIEYISNIERLSVTS
ncbi:unnamed protein product [Rotaria sp. Silwood1]|nr:unnamed protein product [Rotaria sp. Silwood1]